MLLEDWGGGCDEYFDDIAAAAGAEITGVAEARLPPGWRIANLDVVPESEEPGALSAAQVGFEPSGSAKINDDWPGVEMRVIVVGLIESAVEQVDALYDASHVSDPPVLSGCWSPGAIAV